MPTVVPLEYVEVDDRGVAKLIGTRSKVRQIVVDTRAGLSPADIRAAYPHLSLAQIHAALAYYDAHQADVDAEIEEAARFVDEFKRANPKRLTRADWEARWREKFPDRPFPGSGEPDAD